MNVMRGALDQGGTRTTKHVPGYETTCLLVSLA